MSKMRTEHRPFSLPSLDLCSPQLTQRKFQAGLCRMCGRHESVRPLTRHHLVPHSWFMRQPLALKLIRNAHANIVPLCRPCHDRVDSRDLGERLEARRFLRRSLTQQEVTFAIQVRGRSWIDREYPSF
jgi:5-methylcytosine-specific restriction endonuclease McrA